MYEVNKSEKEKAFIINAEMAAIKQEKTLREFYDKWKVDTTSLDLFIESKQEIFSGIKDKGPLVLVECCIYIPPINDDEPELLGEQSLFTKDYINNLTLSQQKGLTSLPFVKVIASNSSEFIVGSIYSVKDKLSTIEHNPAYTEWWTRRANQPTLEDREPTPPRFKMGWDQWDGFSYKLNKFVKNKSIVEEFIYLVPEITLITVSNI